MLYPHESHLAIVRGGRDQSVVERTPTESSVPCHCFLLKYIGVPVGVEDGGCVSAEEGHQLGGAAILIDGDDGESTTAACFPVDGNILRVGL